MRRIVWALVLVLSAVLLVVEITMDVTAADRRSLYLIFGAMGVVTLAAAVTSTRMAGRFRSIGTSLGLVAFAAVGVTGTAVAVAALAMFIEPHDLALVLVAILLGVGLGGVVAGAVAHPLTKDLEAMSRTAERVGSGDLTARTGVDRRDELGVAATALDKMVAKLESAESEREILLSAIGHDLRTPMGSMQAALEAIQDGVAPDPAAYMRGLSNDLEHLSGLVDDLFLLSKIDSGRLDLAQVELDLSELADEAVEAVAPVAAKRRVSMTVESPGRMGVSADPAALGRVLRNLLTNAVRHSPESGRVTVQIDSGGSAAVITVIDEGAGFSTDVAPSAFDRFVRADSSRNRDTGGTGLGLSIAKSLVEAHGGTIGIEGGPGGRVRFTIPKA